MHQENPYVIEWIFDHRHPAVIKHVGHRLDGLCSGIHGPDEKRVHIIHLDMQANRDAAQGLGSVEDSFRVTHHEERVANLDLRVSSMAIWLRHPE